MNIKTNGHYHDKTLMTLPFALASPWNWSEDRRRYLSWWIT